MYLGSFFGEGGGGVLIFCPPIPVAKAKSFSLLPVLFSVVGETSPTIFRSSSIAASSCLLVGLPLILENLPFSYNVLRIASLSSIGLFSCNGYLE